jgi:hypothetical protein
MFESVRALKPVISVSTVYRPVGSEGAVYSPPASETIVRVSDVPSLRIVTFAPATTAPDESVTVPRMVPLTDCATAVATAATPISSAQHKSRSADLPPCLIDLSSRMAEG